MAGIAYVNGRYGRIDQPAVMVEDRGYQFADGVYEVIKVVDRRFIDLDRHLDRLERSLGELRIPLPVRRAALVQILKETLRRHRQRDALIYLQVSRGVAPRNHLFQPQLRPSLVVTVRRPSFPSAAEREQGVKVVTRPDDRWRRCDIKSIGLLANVLAKQAAAAEGCREAWLIDDAGRVREGAASNAYIVDPDGRLVTHPLGPEILGGVTRQVILDLARSLQIEVVERPFTLADAFSAAEAGLSSTSSWLLPGVAIDGRRVGDGRPGPVIRRIRELYEQRLLDTDRAGDAD